MRLRFLRHPILRSGTVAGVVVGTMICAGLVASGALTVPRHLDTRHASAEFLAAWERSRRTDVVSDGDFRRTMVDGRTLSSASQVVQRWPDRITRQFGSVSGTVDGRELNCSTDVAGVFSCTPIGDAVADPSADAEQRLQRELTTFSGYFSATSPPLYEVNPDGKGCFRFTQRVLYPDPPYGERARFCFDADSGAMTLVRRELRDGTVEVTEFNQVRTEVTANDLSTLYQPGFEVDVPVPATLPPGTALDESSSTVTAPP